MKKKWNEQIKLKSCTTPLCGFITLGRHIIIFLSIFPFSPKKLTHAMANTHPKPIVLGSGFCGSTSKEAWSTEKL